MATSLTFIEETAPFHRIGKCPMKFGLRANRGPNLYEPLIGAERVSRIGERLRRLKARGQTAERQQSR
jgi:hypothetical protein